LSLFTTGELVKVNFVTGKIEVLFNDLVHPHAIRHRNGGYMLSDTEGGSVVLFDERLKFIKRVPLKGAWMQDAMQTKNGIIYIDNFPLPNSINHDPNATHGTSIVEMQDGEVCKTLSVDGRYRFFEVQEVSEVQARHWQKAWGGSDFGLEGFERRK
jgi:hypothetical protein